MSIVVRRAKRVDGAFRPSTRSARDRYMRTFVEWLTQPEVLGLISLVSLALAVGSLVLLPLVVSRLPQDYFTREGPSFRRRLRSEGFCGAVVLVAKNLLGLVLAGFGFAMIVLPGQGLLTLLVATVLLDFPGKHRFERRLVAQVGVKRALDRIRQRFGRPPFDAPKRSDEPSSGH